MKDIAISPPPIVIEDSEEEEPEFVLPELTPQQINLVKTVTQRGLPTEVSLLSSKKYSGTSGTISFEWVTILIMILVFFFILKNIIVDKYLKWTEMIMTNELMFKIFFLSKIFSRLTCSYSKI